MGRTPKLSSKSKQISQTLKHSTYNPSSASIANSDCSVAVQKQVTDFYPVTRSRPFSTRNKEADLAHTVLSPSPSVSQTLISDQSTKSTIDSDGFAIPFSISVANKTNESIPITTGSPRSVSAPPTSLSSSTPTNPSSRSSSRSGTPATPIKRHALPLDHAETRATPSPFKRPKDCSTAPSRTSASTVMTGVVSSSLPTTPSAASTSIECGQPSLQGTPSARRRLVLTNRLEETPDVGPLYHSFLNPISESSPLFEKPTLPDSTLLHEPSRDLSPANEFLLTTQSSQSGETSSFAIPRHYAEILDNLESTDRVLSLMFNRKQTCTFARLKSGVQQITRRNYEPSHLGQLRRVYPEAYNFRIDDRDESTPLENYEPSWNLVVEPNLTSDLPEASLAKSPNKSPQRSSKAHASASTPTRTLTPTRTPPPNEQPVHIRGVLSRLLSPSKALELAAPATLFSPNKSPANAKLDLPLFSPTSSPMRVTRAPPPSPAVHNSAEKPKVAFNASRLLLRKGYFRSRLIDCLRKHHREFMRKNRLAHEKCLNAWHPRFEAALEDRSVVPEIEPAPLPTPAGDEFDARPASACSSASSSASATPCKSARAVLDSIGRMQSARFNKHVQAALAASESNTGSALVSATTPVSPSKGAPDVGAGCTSISVPVTPAKGAPSPAANKLLAGISPALLDKIRAKEAAKKENAQMKTLVEKLQMIAEPADRSDTTDAANACSSSSSTTLSKSLVAQKWNEIVRRGLINRVPTVARLLRNAFLSDRHSSMPRSQLLSRLADSLASYTHIAPADLELCLEYLETNAWAPCESASRWLQRLRTSAGVFFKLDTKAPLPLSFEPACYS